MPPEALQGWRGGDRASVRVSGKVGGGLDDSKAGVLSVPGEWPRPACGPSAHRAPWMRRPFAARNGHAVKQAAVTVRGEMPGQRGLHREPESMGTETWSLVLSTHAEQPGGESTAPGPATRETSPTQTRSCSRGKNAPSPGGLGDKLLVRGPGFPKTTCEG